MVEVDSHLLERLKTIELSILQDYSMFCAKRNLSWCAIYGTLLGAIRHQGFIPWDDDIDIAMPLDDYLSFLETFLGNERTRDYRVQTYDLDPFYFHPFAKIRLPKEHLREVGVSPKAIDGVFIDIFPLVFFPKTFLLRKWHLFFCRLLTFAARNKGYKSSRIKTIFSNILFPFWSAKDCLKRLNKKYCRLNNKYADQYMILAGDSVCFDSKWFSTMISKEFENQTVNVPNGFAEVLKTLFGNYLELPPINERVSKHSLDELTISEDPQ